jgi:cell division protein FtsA
MKVYPWYEGRLKKRPIVAVDAGSFEIRVLVAEENEEGNLRFCAWGEAESKGWKKGGIINLELAEASLRKAIEAAETMYGGPIEHVVMGLGASQVRGVNAHGGINISSRHREIQREDARRAVEEARRVNLPPDREILHVVPQEYTLDSYDGIRDPVGMMGGRLEVHVHVITVAAAARMNVIAVANHAGLIVEETVFEALAAAEAALRGDERELGVVLADIGAGSTEVAAYHRGALQHTFTVAVGGDHFTNDIAVGLRAPIPEAERIKCDFGVAMREMAGATVLIEVPRVGDRTSRLVPQVELAEILQPRAQELIELIHAELHRAGLDRHSIAGMVFTGGGSRLAGLCDLAEQTLNVTARIGLAPELEGAPESLCEPFNTTLMGLLHYAQRLRQARQSKDEGWLDKVKRYVIGGWN